MEWSAWSAHKKHVLCIAGLYAPAVATCDILSSRTAQFEIQKRIRTDSAIYIINLLGQPFSNDAIDQFRAQKFISSPQGLEMSLIFVRNLLSFLQKSSTAFSNNVAVLYQAGSIVQTAFHHAVISGFFGWILKEIPTGICGIYVSHCAI